MSGLYLIALIAIWLFAGRMIYRVWRYWKPADLTRKILHIMIGAVLFSLWFGGAFWEVAGKKMFYDAQVRELCAKDGGVKVYETVKLTPELLDQAGRIWIPYESEAKLSDRYYYDVENRYYHEKDPQVTRRQTRIIRRSDGKALGEYIRYGRGGGDLPGFWHGSNFSCPDPRKIQFESLIFVKGAE
ncbi:MAG: hypothetical protein OEV73_07600 [Desulfobulbaceae bacterium]|nr:hypothetical protein [Desulfobulbaceae bacterium]